MNVPEKGFWRGDKSVVGKASYPKKEKNIKYHVSDESRKETTGEVSRATVD